MNNNLRHPHNIYPSVLLPSASLFSTTLSAASSDVLVCSSLFWARTSRWATWTWGSPALPVDAECKVPGFWSVGGPVNATLWTTVRFPGEQREWASPIIQTYIISTVKQKGCARIQNAVLSMSGRWQHITGTDWDRNWHRQVPLVHREPVLFLICPGI